MIRNNQLAKACDLLGGQTKLAYAIGVSIPFVNQMVKGRRPIPACHCPAIERATKGAIRCEDLRPDVDWSVLRGNSTKAA